MIVKELDPFEATDQFAKAGRRAEEQMAHYLRRAFGDADDLFVLHGLRLERDGDAAQIDHLLIHRYGMIVIESKSVTTQIRINEQGEWSREFGRQLKGMPSPIEQARRQREFLRGYLQEHREALLQRILMGLLQSTFTHMPIDILVAISDSGVIRRPKKPLLPEVVKADQIPGRIKELLREHRRANSLFNLRINEGGYEFRAGEMEKITEFLLQHHRPLRPKKAVEDQPALPPPSAVASPTPEPVPTAPPVEPPTPPPVHSPVAPQPVTSEAPPAQPERRELPESACRGCGGKRLSVEWGRYGYYFKCLDCSQNTPIRENCGQCGGREKVRKSGPQFFSECTPCGTSRLYYVNL